jgi:hypothetical protein
VTAPAAFLLAAVVDVLAFALRALRTRLREKRLS